MPAIRGFYVSLVVGMPCVGVCLSQCLIAPWDVAGRRGPERAQGAVTRKGRCSGCHHDDDSVHKVVIRVSRYSAAIILLFYCYSVAILLLAPSLFPPFPSLSSATPTTSPRDILSCILCTYRHTYPQGTVHTSIPITQRGNPRAPLRVSNPAESFQTRPLCVSPLPFFRHYPAEPPELGRFPFFLLRCSVSGGCTPNPLICLVSAHNVKPSYQVFCPICGLRKKYFCGSFSGRSPSDGLGLPMSVAGYICPTIITRSKVDFPCVGTVQLCLGLSPKIVT
jgi:hypothetical protein